MNSQMPSERLQFKCFSQIRPTRYKADSEIALMIINNSLSC